MTSALLLAAAVELAVPFVPQEKDTCGAAALAMVLAYWGEPVPHDEIAGALLEPERRGIRGARLESFARARGLLAVAYEGDLGQLRDFVAKGRPLVVAWKQAGRFHDVVVVGFDRDAVVVHDPEAGAGRRVPLRAFEERWTGAGRWTLLVLPRP